VLGSFDATRFATGRKNAITFEIYGSRGALRFDFERMNELQYFSRDDEDQAQGFRRILATQPVHPYVQAWWPPEDRVEASPGHLIGYEHSFVHAAADFIRAIHRGGGIAPSFFDGLRCMQVIDAALQSAESGRKVVVQG
jgi:predicted dehydrogenase